MHIKNNFQSLYVVSIEIISPHFNLFFPYSNNRTLDQAFFYLHIDRLTVIINKKSIFILHYVDVDVADDNSI